MAVRTRLSPLERSPSGVDRHPFIEGFYGACTPADRRPYQRVFELMPAK
jgi:hypothetical protein